MDIKDYLYRIKVSYKHTHSYSGTDRVHIIYV